MSLRQLSLTLDPDEARRLAEEELSKSTYDEAKPTWFDRLAQSIADFLTNLLNPSGGDGSLIGLIATVLVVLAIIAVVVVIIVRGRPRAFLTSKIPSDGLLFGEEETRTAAELRSAALERAAAADWTDAIVLQFRALARGTMERGAVADRPGATVTAFAREAARAFPQSDEELAQSARTFDDVRYLRKPGTKEAFDFLLRVDHDVQKQRPAELAELQGVTS